MRIAAGLALMVLMGCESVPAGTPAPGGAERAGARPAPLNLGCDALVAIEADSTAQGVARERAWLAQNYPGFEVLNETQDQCGEVTVDRVVFVHDGVENTVLFDTSAFYGRVDGDDLDDLLDG